MHVVTPDDATACWSLKTYYGLALTDVMKDAIIRAIDRAARHHKRVGRPNTTGALRVTRYMDGRELWRVLYDDRQFIVMYVPRGHRILTFSRLHPVNPEGRCKRAHQ